MPTERIINMHTHIFPTKIAEKAVGAIGDFYDIKMQLKGTPEYILEDGKNINVEKYLVSSTATTAHQVESINNFIAAEQAAHPEFIGYGSIHPDYEDIPGEIERIINLGLHGIKLHPDFQKFNIDDEAAYPIYEAAQGRLPILFHTGDNRYDFSKPKRLYNIIEKFPKLVATAAHLGGYRCWEEAQIYFSHPRIYIDTSSALMFVSPEEASKIIHAHGADRVFFGTDSPMWSHQGEMERFNKLEITSEERRMILSGNALKFFNME